MESIFIAIKRPEPVAFSCVYYVLKVFVICVCLFRAIPMDWRTAATMFTVPDGGSAESLTENMGANHLPPVTTTPKVVKQIISVARVRGRLPFGKR